MSGSSDAPHRTRFWCRRGGIMQTPKAGMPPKIIATGYEQCRPPFWNRRQRSSTRFARPACSEAGDSVGDRLLRYIITSKTGFLDARSKSLKRGLTRCSRNAFLGSTDTLFSGERNWVLSHSSVAEAICSASDSPTKNA